MLKILFMLLILAVLALPFLPIKAPFTFCYFNFPEKKRPKNLIYIAGTLILIILLLAFLPYILRFASWFASLKFIKWLLGFIPAYANYSTKILNAVFVNLLFCAAVLFASWISGILYGRYPKFTPKSLKQIFAESKIRRQKRKEERAAKKAEEQKKEEKTENKEEDKKDEKFEGLPEKLVPPPEPEDNSGFITIFGKKEPDKVSKNKTKGIPAAVGNEGDSKELTVKKLLLKLLSLFYFCHEGVWYVQPQCKKVAKHLRNFIIFAGIVYLAVFAVLLIPVFFAVKNYATEFYNLMLMLVDNCYIYPAVSLALLTQIFWFMNGKLPEEPVDTVSYKKGKQTARTVDLDAIERQLTESFGKEYEIKSFYSGDVENVQNSRNSQDISENYILQNVLAFVKSQKLVRNDDYLKGISMLDEGADVLFDAPLYTAVSMYLYPYLNIRISQGERLIVICQDSERIQEIVENLSEGFRRVARTHTCPWNIATRKEIGTDNETDILVVSPSDFLDDKFFTEARDFLHRTTVALFPDADSVVMSNNYLCMVIAERLRQATGCNENSAFVENDAKKVQYIFLSTRHTLNLARSLKEYFLLEDSIYNVQAEYAYGSVRLYVWRPISEARVMLDNSAQTVGLETAISNVARKMGVPSISMFTNGAVFPNQIDPAWLETYDIFDRPIGFTIVSDESFNLPGTIYTYSRYVGKEASVLHVISKPYMLRDYFYDSAIRSLYERPLMERGMTEHAGLEQTSMILLLCRLMKGIPVTVFASKMEEITGNTVTGELTFPVIESLVSECLSKAFGRPATADECGFYLSRKFDDNFNLVKFIQIREKGVLDELMADTQLVTVQIGQSTQVIPLFKRMLPQKYIKGQHMVIDHASYKITAIDYEEGRIIATPATSVHNVPDQYIQVREYSFAEGDGFVDYCRNLTNENAPALPENVSRHRNLIDGNSEIKSITMVRALGGTTVSSKTVAFYDSTNCPGQLDLLNSSVFYVETNLEREVKNAMYLRFDGEYTGSDKITMTLAVLLQEMMKTMFPDQHFCISVCPVLRDPKGIYESGDDHSKRIAKMYHKLTNWEGSADGAIELIIMDDCKGGTGVLDILYDPEATYLKNILDMLYDYLGWLEKHPEDKYLCFGAEECPALFELSRVKDLISVFSRQYVRENDLFAKLQLSDCCTFCGEKLASEQTYLWNNKHNICEHCENEYRPTDPDYPLILKNVTAFIRDSFGISVGDDISVAASETVEFSELNVEERIILVNPNLPLTALHSQVLMQTVRLWQLENLFVTGECEFEGQLLFVLIQYLTSLKQHKRCKRFHSRALVGSDDRSEGYCRLRQALLAISSDNSFKYMLDTFGKNGKSPVIRTDPRRSTRKTGIRKPNLYYYSILDENRKKAYDTLVKGLMDMSPEINIAEYGIESSELQSFWLGVMNDHPEIHWVDPYAALPYTTDSSHTVLSINPNYCISKEEKDRRQREIDNELPKFIENVTDDMGDFETALQVFRNMAKAIDYDSLELDRQKRRKAAIRARGGKFEEPDDIRNIYGALVERRSVCAGYAKAYQYILNLLGMEAVFVGGECIDGGGHAWNIINMEGDYYHVDVTWGDGSNTDPSKNSKFCSFGYFGLNDKDIRVSRIIDEFPPVPECTEIACNYFVRMGLYFKAYDHIEVKNKLTEMLSEKERTRVDMRFETVAVLDAAVNQLINNGGVYELLKNTGRPSKYTYISDPKLKILTVFLDPDQSDNQ